MSLLQRTKVNIKTWREKKRKYKSFVDRRSHLVYICLSVLKYKWNKVKFANSIQDAYPLGEEERVDRNSYRIPEKVSLTTWDKSF